MNGWAAFSAYLTIVADCAEDAIAGGRPAKRVAQEIAAECRRVAGLAAMAGDGRIAAAELADLLCGAQEVKAVGLEPQRGE